MQKVHRQLLKLKNIHLKSISLLDANGGSLMLDKAEKLHPYFKTENNSNYRYGLNDSTINIGLQTLYLPTGIIYEVIKRDKILFETLNLLIILTTLPKKAKFIKYQT